MIGSQQRLELLHGEAGVAYDSTHRERVDRIVARDRNNPGAVSHDDVFALPSDSKSGLLKRFHRCKMVDAGNPRHR